MTSWIEGVDSSIDPLPHHHCQHHQISWPLLLVQLLRPLLKFLLASRFAKVVGDDRTRVGLVVLESGGTTAGGLVVGVVEGMRRGVGVAGLLCDLVGDA
jgi:hypothetical protein